MRFIRIIATLLALSVPAWAQMGTPKSSAALNTEVNAFFQDQNIGQVIPFNTRLTFLDIIASFLNSTSPSSVFSLPYLAPGTGAVSRNLGSKLNDIVSVIDYGAKCDRSTDDTTAFQNAVNSVSAGGVVLVPTSGCNIAGTVTISNPLKVECSNFLNASTGTINASGAGNTIFAVNADFVTIRDCYLNRAGATVGDAIDVGLDYKTFSDGVAQSGNATFTSLTANFTSADTGKNIAITAAGPGGGLLTNVTITYVNSTTVTLSGTPTGNVNPATFSYGKIYKGFVADNLNIVNHAVGIALGDVGAYHVNRSYINATNPLLIFDHVGQGFGSSELSGNEFLAGNSSYGIIHNAGSDLRIVNNKFLGGLSAYNMNWSQSSEANLIIANNSIENYQTSGINITTPTSYDRIIIEGNSFLGTGGNSTCAALLVVDNSSAAAVNDLQFTGNSTKCTTFTGTAISVGKVNQPLIANNVLDIGNGGTAIAVLSNSVNARVMNNYRPSAALITNAGTGTLIVDANGVTTANLPASPANGSQVFATDADPASSPCTHAGAQTGSLAIRQNGAWKCF